MDVKLGNLSQKTMGMIKKGHSYQRHWGYNTWYVFDAGEHEHGMRNQVDMNFGCVKEGDLSPIYAHV